MDYFQKMRTLFFHDCNKLRLFLWNIKQKRKFETEQSTGGLSMQKLPVTERFKWHVVHRAAHVQPHKTTHVSWFWRTDFFCLESNTAKSETCVWQTVESHRCCVWHSTPQSSVERWRQNTQIWVKAVRSAVGSDENCTIKIKTLSISQLIFDYWAYSWQRLESTARGQRVPRRTGSLKCGFWAGICNKYTFKNAHMPVFYQQAFFLSLHPLLLFPSLPLLPHPPLQWWGILCWLLQRSVCSLWAMFLWLEALIK